MVVSAATNVTTGSAGSSGTAALTVVTVLNKGVTTGVPATLVFNDGDGINRTIPVTTTGGGSHASGSQDGQMIKSVLEGIPEINAKYMIGQYNPDQITITQRDHTGDVTIVVTLSDTSTPIDVNKPVTGVAKVPGMKDQDKFTVTNVATSNGYIIVRISDNIGLTNTDVTVSGITTADTRADIATKIANALNSNSMINARYTVTASGDDVELETKSTVANSITVSLQ